MPAVVGINTVPVLLTLNSVVVALAVELPIAKSVELVSPLLAWMESLANGEVVPMPTFTVKTLFAEKVFVSPRRVEDAAVIVFESPRLKVVPLTVMEELVRPALLMVPVMVGVTVRLPAFATMELPRVVH